jgi:hypothetical protein
MAIFMKTLKMVLKVKYFEVNKDSKLHIANSTYNTQSYLKEVKMMQK